MDVNGVLLDQEIYEDLYEDENKFRQLSQRAASPEFQALIGLLTEHNCSTKNSNEVNFIDKFNDDGYYKIPEYLLPEFYQKLYRCNVAGLQIGFLEKANPNSALVVEIPILWKLGAQNRTFEKNRLFILVKRMVTRYFGIVENKTYDKKFYVSVLQPANPVHNQSVGAYVDEIRVIMHNFLLSRVMRVQLLAEFKKDIDEWASATKNTLEERIAKPLSETLQTKPSVYIPCYGSIHDARLGAFRVVKTYEVVDLEQIDLVDTDDITASKNPIYEMSVNYAQDIVDKCSILEQSVDITENEVSDYIYEASKYSYSLISLQTLLTMLSKHRFERDFLWKKLLEILVKTGITNSNSAERCSPDRFKHIGELFSTRNGRTVAEFDAMWNIATQNVVENETNHHISINTIYGWAYEDAEDRYFGIITGLIRKYIRDLICQNKSARFGHKHIGDIIYEACRHKFKTTGTGHDYKWYEFMYPADCRDDLSQVFKWSTYDTNVRNSYPSSLQSYVSEKIPPIFRRVINEITALITRGGISADIKRFYEDIIKELYGTINQLANIRFIEDSIRMSAAAFIDRTFEARLNKEPWVFGVANGVVELSANGTVDLIETCHNYAVTMHTKARYIPRDIKTNPACQQVLQFYHSLFPADEQEMCEFNFYKYAKALDRYKRPQRIYLNEGHGSNGKSTDKVFFANMFAPYAQKISPTLITVQRRDANNATPAIMLLEDARYVLFSEPDSRQRVLADGVVKDLTGGENQSGRHLYVSRIKQFEPMVLYESVSNYPYIIRTTDHGIWRRLRKYSYKNQFVDRPRAEDKYERLANSWYMDTMVKSTLMQEALLAIICEYFKKLYTYYDGELDKVPQSIMLKESLSYRNDQDQLHRYITIYAVKSPGCRTPMDDVHDAYRTWYLRNVGNTDINTADIGAHFKHSALQKYISEMNRESVLHDIRILRHSTEQLNEGESYLITIDDDAKTEKISEPEEITEKDELLDSENFVKVENDEGKN